MKKFLTILILILTSNSLTIADSRTPIEVIKIFDGDTIEARVNANKKFKIRLIGIDCYETSNIHRAYRQAYDSNISINEVIKRGENSKQFLEKLYSKKPNVYLDFQGVDIYGRALGVLYFDKINVNQTLLKDGGCFEYYP